MMTAHARLARIARQVLRERYASIEDQADAMAAAVITELGLTEETHNLIDPAWHIWQERIVGVERRLVSPWVRAEEQS